MSLLWPARGRSELFQCHLNWIQNGNLHKQDLAVPSPLEVLNRSKSPSRFPFPGDQVPVYTSCLYQLAFQCPFLVRLLTHGEPTETLTWMKPLCPSRRKWISNLWCLWQWNHKPTGQRSPECTWWCYGMAVWKGLHLFVLQLRVLVWTCVHEWRCPRRLEEGVGSPGTRVTQCRCKINVSPLSLRFTGIRKTGNRSFCNPCL